MEKEKREDLMEDIEDLFAGGAGGAPPGFRLPLNAVGVNPKRNASKRSVSKQKDEVTTDSNRDSLAPPSMKIPGTQVVLLHSLDLSFINCFDFSLHLLNVFFFADDLHQDVWLFT